MLRHYLLVALRNARKRKSATVINIAGLAIAMACCILILVFVTGELRYDAYHTNAEQICRLASNLTLGGTPNAIATTNAPPGPAMVEEFPEVVDAVRLRPMGKQPVRVEDRHFYEERMLYADGSIFDVFSFPLTRGNPDTALADAFTVVITEEIAEKYFGDDDPVGRTLEINGRQEFTVTGVLENVRSDSHFVFDMLFSFETLLARNREMMESWSSPFIHYTYLQLTPGADVGALEQKLPALVEKHMGQGLREYGAALEYFLQPLSRIHLHSDLRHELAANGSFAVVTIFISIGVGLLLIACFNFMNLATARSATRAKEVGVRKVLGASRSELIRQFLVESLLASLIALGLALLLAHLALPWVGDLMAADSVARAEGSGAMAERVLTIDYLAMPWLLPAFLGLAIVIGLVAGSYPAFFLASFDPSRTLKGGFRGARGNAIFRRALVTLQFALSLVLIIATGVVLLQQGHLRTVELGFDKEHVVVIPVMDPRLRASVPALEESLRALGSVKAAGASSHVLGGRPSGASFAPEGYPEGETEMMDRMIIDAHFLEALGMKLARGRGFDEEFPSDEQESILINEAAARKFGWDDAVGKTIRPPGAPTGKTVVGVVRDFHFSSPHREIGPIHIEKNARMLRNVYVRIAAEDVAETIDALQAQWVEFDPSRPFDYFFLDESYDRQFQAEKNLGTLFTAFTALAILIACLGLYGMAAYAAQRRTKEIGIRKVLGASVPGLVLLLSRELIALCLVANVVAWPVAWFLTARWLERFPHRVELSFGPFLAAGLGMLVVGLLTTSLQSARAGLADPVDTLRVE